MLKLLNRCQDMLNFRCTSNSAEEEHQMEVEADAVDVGSIIYLRQAQ